MKKKILMNIVLLIYNSLLLAQVKVCITDFGAIKDNHDNVLPALNRAITYCKAHPGITLSFPKGRYDFWPTDIDGKIENVAFKMTGVNHLTIDGEESEFIFHGYMGISHIDSCSNIIFKNFSVDWDRPWISQAEIVNATDNYLDVKIDKKEYPFVIINKRIIFMGEGIQMPILDVYNNLYDKYKKEIVYNTWDKPLGNFFNGDTEELENGIVRFHAKPKIKPESGTILALYHAHYGISGFVTLNSKEVFFENLQIYHAVGNGFLGVRSENIKMNNASVMANEKKKRVFSTVADASHFSSCKGTITVENCTHTGQGDDFINVHGRNVLISKMIDSRTIEVKSSKEPVFANDEYWFVNHVTGQRGNSDLMISSRPIEGKDEYYLISFQNDIPNGVKEGDFIENKSWTPNLILRNCKILKRHRARGILVTTPKNVIIENNYFRTAGTAILIEGDMDYWFESGANNNVQIRNNIFEDCLSSGNAHGTRSEWGEAVITITPSHRPVGPKAEAYHKNIHIINNVFKVFDAPLLRARSVDGLLFNENNIIKTYSYKPYTWQKCAFLLDGCRHVQIKSNIFDVKYTTRKILIENMIKDQVYFDKQEGLSIDYVKNLKTKQDW